MGKYNDYFERFESIEQFRSVLNGRETNKVFKGKEASKDLNASFKGTKDYQEADALLTNGDATISSRLISVLGKMKPFQGGETMKRVKDVTGFGVNVSRALTGSAKTMYRRRKEPDGGRILDVVINGSIPASVRAESIEKKLCEVFSVINFLERNDLQTNIYIYLQTESLCEKQKITLAIKVKDAGQPLNITRCAYPCTHPSMIRRHFLRFIETTPVDVDGSLTPGYGKPNFKTEKKYFESKNPVYFFSLGKEVTQYRGVEDYKEEIYELLS